MPTYPYSCNCGCDFDVTARMSEIDKTEVKCPSCDIMLSSKNRNISKSGSFYAASVEDAEFCNALGCVVKNKKHRKQIAKQRGLVEIGNESTETIRKHFDDERKEDSARRKKEMEHDVMSAFL